MENEIYLNYGNDAQINQNDFLNAAANNVESYLSKQSWSSKRKDLFRKAYQDIMSKGVTGASNTSGVWEIQHNGDPIDLSSLSKKEQEMYGEAAYYIQQQMNGLQSKKQAEEKKKSDNPVFNNEYFTKNFHGYIGTKTFGGRNWSIGGENDDWNKLDERDSKTGLRGTNNRALKLADMLEGYSNSLKEEELNFEGSPFTDLNDFRTRVNTAITQLRNGTWDQNDVDALNAIGLDSRNYFNNGSGDIFTADDGQQYTYGDYYGKVLPAQEKAKQDAAIAKQKAVRANQYTNYRFFGNKLNGTPPTGKDVLSRLNSYATKSNLTGQEQSEIVGAFKFAARNGALQNLSKEELAKFGPMWQGRTQNLRKINGLNGFYWDISGNRVVQPYNQANTPSVDFQGLVDQNSPEALKQKQQEQAAVNMNTAFKDIKEFTPEMQKELEALAWDAASIINPEALTGSGMAIRAAYLRDEANPNRGTLERWLDYGTGALGGIQFAGDLLMTGKLGYRLYQMGKTFGSVSKFLGLVGAGFGAIGAYEAKDSVAKLVTDGWQSLTPQDVENISYGLMGLIGLKSFTKARNKQTIGKQANPTTTEHSITINDKNGKSHEVKVDETTAKEVNDFYTLGSKKTTADTKTFNHEKVKKAVEEYNRANTEKLDLEGASVQSSNKFGRVTKKDAATSKKVRNPNAPEYEPVGTNKYNPFGYLAQGNSKWGYYFGGGWQRKAWENAAPEQSNTGLRQRIKEFWNPEPKVKENSNSSQTSATQQTNSQNNAQTSTQSTTNPQTTTPVTRENQFNKATIKRYKDVMSGKFSKNKLQSGNYDVNGSRLQVVEQTDGTFNVIFKGNIEGNFRNQQELQKTIRDIIKNQRKVITGTTTSKIDTKQMGKLLQDFKRKGWLKQGGQINRQKINKYKEFIKK